MDLAHTWGGDLGWGPTGDLATAATPLLTQQRVLRRLLTNVGDYIWQTGYGAGLPQFVGQPANALPIRAVIRAQILQEAAVAAIPEPSIDVTARADGTVAVQLRFSDAPSQQTQLLGFTLGT